MEKDLGGVEESEVLEEDAMAVLDGLEAKRLSNTK